MGSSLPPLSLPPLVPTSPPPPPTLPPTSHHPQTQENSLTTTPPSSSTLLLSSLSLKTSKQKPGKLKKTWTQIPDRVAFFNIAAGDKVRVVNAHEEIMWLSPKKGKKGSVAREEGERVPKIFTVKHVRKDTGQVYLDGLSVRPFPPFSSSPYPPVLSRLSTPYSSLHTIQTELLPPSPPRLDSVCGLAIVVRRMARTRRPLETERDQARVDSDPLLAAPAPNPERRYQAGCEGGGGRGWGFA